jgi:hypothetical protein
MFQSIKGYRMARLLVATVSAGALFALSVGQVFAGWYRGG